MKINKKYEPNKKKINIEENRSTANCFFPVIFPSYNKISGKQLAPYLFQSVEWNARCIDSERIEPYFLRNVDTLGDIKELEGKEKLPFPAKLQRLATRQEKFYKKNLPIFAQIFAQHHLEHIDDFLLSDPKNQTLLSLLAQQHLLKEKEVLVYWDTKAQCMVEEDGIEWRKEPVSHLVVKCFVETKNDMLPIVVDDPLLFFSDVGIIVHSNDKRYKKHIGKNIILPIINKHIPIFGIDGIDTITNNGIQRLNPYFDQNALERVKSFGLPLDENYIDDQGCFNEKVTNFGGKSVFEFLDNIIDLLQDIGSLISKEEVIEDVPYSKATGQKLIKKISTSLILDFSHLEEEYNNWIQELFPEYFSTLTFSRPEISIDSSNIFTQKISYLRSPDKEDFILFDLNHYKDLISSPLSYLLLDQLRKKHLPWEFTMEDLIDLLFLLPENERKDVENQIGMGDTLKEIQMLFKDTTSEKVVDLLLETLSSISWIESIPEDTFIFNQEKVWGDNILYTIMPHDSFLQALALVYMDSKILLHLDELSLQTIKTTYLFQFLLKRVPYTPLPIEDKSHITTSFPERYPKLAEEYGRESLRFFLMFHTKFDEKGVVDAFGYLKHLWNLFRILYQCGGFTSELPETYTTEGKGTWILEEWELIKINLTTTPYRSEKFAHYLSLLQKYTKEQFTWNLLLLREEEEDSGFLLAGTLYLDIIKTLSPIIPEFVLMIESTLGKKLSIPNIAHFKRDKKDYKTNLIFDIFRGIQDQKEALQLKKHIPIDLCLQGNPAILGYIKDHESLFTTLFRVKNFSYNKGNFEFPEGYSIFSVFDLTVGIQESGVIKEVNHLEEYEREMKEKQQSADYLRSMLVALSLNPLTPRENIESKEKELDLLSDEIQQLEIKIQKAKMEKKQ